MKEEVWSNSIVCYFTPDSTGLVAAFRDKAQTSFLLRFLKDLKPEDIDVQSNWITVKCEQQISQEQVDWLNDDLQERICGDSTLLPLKNCVIYLKVLFEIGRVIEDLEITRDKQEQSRITSDDSSFDGVIIPHQEYSDLLKRIHSLIHTGIPLKLYTQREPSAKELAKFKKRASILDAKSDAILLTKLQRKRSTIRPLKKPADPSSALMAPPPQTHTALDSPMANPFEPLAIEDDSPVFSIDLFGGHSALTHDSSPSSTARMSSIESGLSFADSREDIAPKSTDHHTVLVGSSEKGIPDSSPIPRCGYTDFNSELYSTLHTSHQFDSESGLPILSELKQPSMIPKHVELAGLKGADYPADGWPSVVNLKSFVDGMFSLPHSTMAKWIREKSPSIVISEGKIDRRFQICDVRGRDFVGGNIFGVYRVPFEDVRQSVGRLIAVFHERGLTDVVFHCMYSQHRGPRFAFMYWTQRRIWERQHPSLPKQRVWLLDGGFKKFLDNYMMDPSLIVNFDRSYWDSETFPLTGREFFYVDDWKPEEME